MTLSAAPLRFARQLCARWRPEWLVAAALAAGSAAYAVDDIELALESARGADWHAEDIAVHWRLGSSWADIKVRSLALAAWPEPWRDLIVECTALEVDARTIACAHAIVTADVPRLGRQRFNAQARYEPSSGALNLKMQALELGTGKLDLDAVLQADGWRAQLVLDKVPLASLADVATAFDFALPIVATDGTVSLTAQVHGHAADIATIQARGTLAQVTVSNESSSIATDALDMSIELALTRGAASWTYEATVDARAGQAYVDPVFLDFGANALHARANGVLHDDGRVAIEALEVDHRDVLRARARETLVDLNAAPFIRELDVDLDAFVLPAAFTNYVQPLLLDTSVSVAEARGHLSGRLRVREGAAERIDVVLRDIEIDADKPSLAVRGLTGEWHWRARTEPNDRFASQLGWTGGRLFGLELGASRLSFATAGSDFVLLEPTRIPLLDGALELAALSAHDIGSSRVGFNVDATIHPISVPHLSRAFGWPEFGGRLSGKLSNLELEEGVLRLGTRLEANVFDGLVVVSDMRLEDPFGAWPRFFADIDLEALDLELVTSAFSFGRITGRLSGFIHGLELFNWSPVAFDARLITTPGDRSRHRISQRAVQNIGNIGGGGASVTAALSSGFLRFFDDFNYKRLGISCTLRNDVCEMSGVAPAPRGGYYIVQGRGLPRIDVIGDAASVDWPRLLQQLVAATQSSGPVVQ
jgi:hypothetical protein